MPNITSLAATQQDLILSLSEARDRWRVASEHLDYAAGTRHKYLQATDHFLAWVSSTWPEVTTVAHITPISLVSYRHALQHEQRLSSSTINLRLNALRTWCAWLEVEGYLTTNPAAHLHLVEQQQVSKREGLTPTQMDALLHLAQGSRHPERNYAIVQLLLQTGLRVDECSQLSCDDIIFGERSGTVTVRAGKGNKARTIPLNATARTALAGYMALRLHSAPTIKAAAAVWNQEHGLLWHSQKKGRLSTAAIERMIGELVRQAGTRVPQATSAHTLRHTFARNYLSQYPGDIVGLAALLGHSSLDTTRLYSEPTVSELAARVEHMHSNAYM
ncbi:tyrosine recombinase XerC [Dictyobacter sp. S3.2.2.5]|uniref:Tyrosine recombinase XerC n=1 Tax=Dictyobacter halimunensis TaxID=3026934 RepID=A0ABQ6G6I5_9CHLR|nr:tyrosine recombinase XerC [Dictyobacter sp. S3.2.2.5]